VNLIRFLAVNQTQKHLNGCTTHFLQRLADRRKAWRAACASNTHQLGNGVMMYANAYNDFFPLLEKKGHMLYSFERAGSQYDGRYPPIPDRTGMTEWLQFVGGDKNLFYCPGYTKATQGASSAKNGWRDLPPEVGYSGDYNDLTRHIWFDDWMGYIYLGCRWDWVGFIPNTATILVNAWRNPPFDDVSLLRRTTDDWASTRVLLADHSLVVAASASINWAHTLGDPEGSNALFGDGHAEWRMPEQIGWTSDSTVSPYPGAKFGHGGVVYWW